MPQLVVADAAISVALRSFVERHGTVSSAKHFGVSRETLAKLIAGLPTRNGSLALIRERLAAASEKSA